MKEFDINTENIENVDENDEEQLSESDIKEVDQDKIVIKNIVITDISEGNRPLHGTKELVKMAISFSRGESIILVPVTPTALHPTPMHIVRACLPQELLLLKYPSKLKAILGNIP